MNATIMLAKGYEPNKLVFPVMVSEKLDGVPAKIHITIMEDVFPPSSLVSKRILWTVQTRQAKPYVSIHNQVEAFAEHLKDRGCLGTFVFIAEVTHQDRTMPFKDVSGHCRRQKQNDDLRLNIFDYYRPTLQVPDRLPFGKRILLAQMLVRGMFWCKMVPQILCKDSIELAHALTAIKRPQDGFIPEGAIIRNCKDIWEEGKRSWGYQKVVDDPTTEVSIVGFDEAISKEGDGSTGIIGRIHAIYNGQAIGISPGKLSHDERRALWKDTNTRDLLDAGELVLWATVKYKRDPSYEALRQPTFQHWRPDYDGLE